jgi:hypothetical protein
LTSPEEQYKALVILQTRALSESDSVDSVERKSAVDLLADLEAAPAGELLITAVGAILYEHAGAAMKGTEVPPAETLRRVVAAAAQV